MNNIIPFTLPAGPFFCARDGRYLPGLTDLVIEAAAMQQRREIEENLFKIRLKQKCFLALATAVPASVECRVSSDLNFPEGATGSDHGRELMGQDCRDHAGTRPPDSISLPKLSAEEHNRFPKGRW